MKLPLLLALLVAGCSDAPDEAVPPSPAEAAPVVGPEAEGGSDEPGVEAPAPWARSGVGVCRALEPALSAASVDGLGLDRYATPEVLAELRANGVFRDSVSGEPQNLDTLSSWVDDGQDGACNLAAGGDAWYVLTLGDRPGGGQAATAVRLTTSYDEGGP